MGINVPAFKNNLPLCAADFPGIHSAAPCDTDRARRIREDLQLLVFRRYPRSQAAMANKNRYFAMKSHSLSIFAALLCVSASYSMAQNSIGVRECILEPAKVKKEQALDSEPYILRLKVRCALASQEIAYLKVAIDPKEELNFVTVAEKRLRKGKAIPLEFEIPIEDWKTEKLSVFLLMQGKDPKPDDVPLANITRVIERASVLQK